MIGRLADLWYRAGMAMRIELPRIVWLPLAAALGLSLAACGDAGTPPQAAPIAPPAVVSAPAAPVDVASFDRIVNAETVFPDPAVRARYRAQPPVTENGQRSYAFQLLPQPGMDEKRHFGLVTITWARGGSFVKPGAAAPSGVGGPGGGFIDAFAQTADGAYDVRVTQGMLLPAGIELPAFDIRKAAAEMVRLYQAQQSKP